MIKQNKKIVLIIYTITFYSVWAIFELFGKEFIDNIIENEYISQLIKSGIIKSIVWTLPAILLIYNFKSDVYVTLKEMFSTKVNWLKYLPIFIIFTVWILIVSILQNGKLEIVSDFGINEVIIVIFVGLTEEIAFRGWLLNATIREDKKWICILINSIMFLAIHFPKYIYNGTFANIFISFDFLGIIILSIIFSHTFIKSKNILVPITLHMYWDLLIFMFL